MCHESGVVKMFPFTVLLDKKKDAQNILKEKDTRKLLIMGKQLKLSNEVSKDVVRIGSFEKVTCLFCFKIQYLGHSFWPL